MNAGAARVTFAGHATVRIDLAGRSVLTDPVLKRRVAHLRRRSQPVAAAISLGLDAVLISHLHFDHLDIASLKIIPGHFEVIVPRGAGKLLASAGFGHVTEMSEGESVELGDLTIRAVKADHDGRRRPGGASAETLGYVLEGAGENIYFAGDTDVYPEMSGLVEDLDLALLPVWGWGHTLGTGHMDPAAAARAAALLKPKLTIPIHWGTLFPMGMRRWQERFLVRPPLHFKDCAAVEAPDTEVRILQPGESLEIS